MMCGMSVYRSQRSVPRKRQRQKVKPWRAYWPVMVAGLLLGLILAAGIWIWECLNDPHTLPFREVRIYGQFQHLQAPVLRQKVKSQIHSGFFALKLEPIKQTLMTEPWVEDVAIRRIPGVLLVTVREHQPIARWNKDYLINSDDQLFPAPRDAPAQLPRLQGPEQSEAEVLANYQQINALLKPLQLQIAQITLDQRQSWQLILNNGVTVTIGQDEVLPRIQRLVHWYPKIINDKVNPVVHIDLRYSNSIAVEFKKNS